MSALRRALLSGILTVADMDPTQADAEQEGSDSIKKTCSIPGIPDRTLKSDPHCDLLYGPRFWTSFVASQSGL